MRLLYALLLMGLVNGAAYVVLTRPTSKELGRLELSQRELSDDLAIEEKSAEEWIRLVELVETAQPVLERFPSAERSAQAALRRAFLDAEKGLGLRRDTLEFRPEKRRIGGFGGVRIRVIQAGHFASIVTYLDRLSHLKVPMAPVDLSLAEAARGPEPIVLTVTFSALWPAESGS